MFIGPTNRMVFTSVFQIGSVQAHQPLSHQQQQQQPSPQPQPQVAVAGAGTGAGAGAGTTGVQAMARAASGMFCYHCPSGLQAPRLPPSLEYPFAPTHPCKQSHPSNVTRVIFIALIQGPGTPLNYLPKAWTATPLEIEFQLGKRSSIFFFSNKKKEKKKENFVYLIPKFFLR